MGSAVFDVADHLGAELSFTVAVGLEVSGFLAAADVVAVVGFLAIAPESGRLTSFLAGKVLGGCVAVVLPVEDAVVGLEVVVLAAAVVEGFVVAVVGLDVVGAGLDVEGPVAGLEVFKTVAAAFVVAEGLGFVTVDTAGLLVVAVVLGLVAVTVSAPGLFLTVPFAAVGLVPFVAVAEVVLAGPTGFLSGTLVWFLTMQETFATPTGLLGTAPAAAADFIAVVVVFPTAAAATLLEDLTSFDMRW